MIIFHDYGSADNAGFFSHSFLSYFGGESQSIIKILHKNYPFKTKRKVILFGFFDKFPASYFFKFVEIFFVCIFIFTISFLFFLVKRQKVKLIINIYQPFKFYYLLMKYNFFAYSYPIIHDVVTHKNHLPKYIQVDIQNFANNFECILLSEHSEEMFKAFKPEKKYHVLPFPLYKNEIYYDKSDVSKAKMESSKIKIGFMGNLRYEKGIDIILEAIKNKHFDNVEIIIAGNNMMNIDINEDYFPCVNFRLHFISPNEYANIFKSLDYCFLIYDSNVSNSGVLYDALSFGTIPIVSKIDLFNSHFLKDVFIFIDGSLDLSQKLDEIDRGKINISQDIITNKKKAYNAETKIKYLEFLRKIK